MKALLQKLKELIGIAGALFFICPILFLFLILLLGGPILLITETLGLVQLTERTQGTLVSKYKTVMPGKSRKEFTYRFVVAGTTIESHQVYPGFLGRNVADAERGLFHNEYEEGEKYNVYYNPSDPGQSCLELGWRNWSFGWTAIVWGQILLRTRVARKRRWRVLLNSFVLYGGWLIFVGPSTIAIDALTHHLFAFCSLMLFVTIYATIRDKPEFALQASTTETEQPASDQSLAIETPR